MKKLQEMQKLAQQSLLDVLVDIIPSLKNVKMVIVPSNKGNDPVDKKLFEIWSNEKNKISKRKFRKPINLSSSDLKNLEVRGYVQVHGNNLKITQRGANLLNKMILENDVSIFDSIEKKSISKNSIKKFAFINKNNKNWYNKAKNRKYYND